MEKYCPYCGRLMPEDGIICPYCAKSVGQYEGIKVETEQELQKKEKTPYLVIIAILFLIIAPIATAVTIYVFVSGMLDDATDMINELYSKPEISVRVRSNNDLDNKNATLKILNINSENSVYTYSLSYKLYDLTDNEELIEDEDYSISSMGFLIIESGREIKINGLNDELEKGNKYKLTIIYILTNEVVTTVNWIQ